jgi:hypothetical protein
MSAPTREQELEEALRTMAYAYLRILEIGPQSAFAARAYQRACELVEVDPASKQLWATPPAETQPKVLWEGWTTGLEETENGAILGIEGPLVGDPEPVLYDGTLVAVVLAEGTADL